MLTHGAFGWDELLRLLHAMVSQLAEESFESRRAGHWNWLASGLDKLACGSTAEARADVLVMMVDGFIARVRQAKQDTMNIRLRLQFETLRPQAVLFERSLACSCLQEGSLQLDQTKRWLLAARREMSVTAAIPADLSTLHRYAVW